MTKTFWEGSTLFNWGQRTPQLRASCSLSRLSSKSLTKPDLFRLGANHLKQKLEAREHWMWEVLPQRRRWRSSCISRNACSSCGLFADTIPMTAEMTYSAASSEDSNRIDTPVKDPIFIDKRINYLKLFGSVWRWYDIAKATIGNKKWDLIWLLSKDKREKFGKLT